MDKDGREKAVIKWFWQFKWLNEASQLTECLLLPVNGVFGSEKLNVNASFQCRRLRKFETPIGNQCPWRAWRKGFQSVSDLLRAHKVQVM